MRASELARLRWRHIDTGRRLTYILKQKNGKQQSIPLNRKAASILDGVGSGRPDDYVFASHQAKREAGRSENTLRTYYHILALFSRTVGTNVLMNDITHDTLRRFIRASDVAPSTYRCRHTHVKAFFICRRTVPAGERGACLKKTRPS